MQWMFYTEILTFVIPSCQPLNVPPPPPPFKCDY